MLRIVGATLVVALVGSRWLNTPGRMGAHKGRPYIDRFGASINKKSSPRYKCPFLISSTMRTNTSTAARMKRSPFSADP